MNKWQIKSSLLISPFVMRHSSFVIYNLLFLGGSGLSKISDFVSENQDEFSRFGKFAIVGAIGAVVDFTVLNLLILGFDWQSFFGLVVQLGIPQPLIRDYDWTKFLANLVSVACAIISNFTWNRLWTFPESRERPLHTQFGKFAIVNLVGLVINQIVFLASDALIYGPLFPKPLDYNLAKATAICVVLFWNFFVNRKWTYRGI